MANSTWFEKRYFYGWNKSLVIQFHLKRTRKTKWTMKWKWAAERKLSNNSNRQFQIKGIRKRKWRLIASSNYSFLFQLSLNSFNTLKFPFESKHFSILIWNINVSSVSLGLSQSNNKEKQKYFSRGMNYNNRKEKDQPVAATI